jgi:hypothetical protein
MLTKRGAMRTIFRRIAYAGALFLLLALAGTHFLPLIFNEPDIINQTALQSTRAQRIAKDAMILTYRPSSERAQAISELQNTLPVFEAQQTKLQTLTNSDLHLLVSQSQSDYTSLVTATKILLNQPDGTTNMTQLQIILDHERTYSLLMSQLASLRTAQIHANNVIFVAVQTVDIVLILVIGGVLFVLSKQTKGSKKEANIEVQ